ncbi:hypothetical protein BDV25DRAFT_151595 [Aspergillus avenaceus]|uniref:CFEM domain-containing protein n=1 Tax=Aspergillus avenaceus TaxID=36643 RepID=A0A5N6U0G9_ASPAV|nr:hypothetical protein BDV25DRAFT_151595 [Aspergillus avenaceus]
MKLQYIPLTLAACLATVAAQGMDGLPDCAKDCATGSIPKKCQNIDVACICGDKNFINDIACCVSTKCSSEQQEAVIKFANQICSGAGVNDLPKSATCASGSSSAAQTSSGSSASTKSSSATTTGTNASASTTDMSGSSDSAAKPTSSDSSSSSKTATSSASSAATSSAGASLVQGNDMNLFAAVGAAAFALLA